MSTNTIVPVVLSGGAGTRLWPLSREMYPKQLLPLAGEWTMLQETVLRLKGLADLGAPQVVCNDAHRFMVAEQLRQIDRSASAVILEPMGRNTAPAVAVAALQARADGDDPLLLVLPADHVIVNAEALCNTIAAGVDAAANGALLTFGIVPTAPETGYGYIKASAECCVLSAEATAEGALDTPSELSTQHSELASSHPKNSELRPCPVEAFVEKPDLTTAEKYVASGDYYWNSGMFMFRASRYLEELKRFAPAMLAACEQAWQGRVADLDFVRLDSEAFAACPSDSIDYAVMEKTDQAMVMPLDAGWNDVGSWSALWEVGQSDQLGNVTFGDIIDVGCKGSYLYSGSRLVAGIGLEDAVVVETADAVLVAAKDRVQEVKEVVQRLKQLDREEHLLHRRVNRPWGAYEALDAGDGFLVKRITVNPGASLSLQRHQHRAEHWVVVRGSAEVVINGLTESLTANQSIYIPVGSKHRLHNPGEQLLEIIEVQTGSVLSEDDIERFDDDYGR